MKLGNSKGFTLIEVIVVAGIIAILAGILVPLIFKEIDESKLSRAAADVKSISTAIMVFKKDTGKWPAYLDDCTTQVTLLVGAGNDPGNDITAIGFDTSVTVSMNTDLQSNNGCYTNWKGPYMANVTADPWGTKYLINAKEFGANRIVWILSAGPNGVVETNPTSAMQVQGDDIGIVLQGGQPVT